MLQKITEIVNMLHLSFYVDVILCTTHGLIAQLGRASERNSVVVGSKSHSGQLSIAKAKPICGMYVCLT